MATFLDVSLLGGAKVVFVFLLVYIIVFGLLTWIRPFGKEASTGPYAVIALAAAFLTIISPTMRYLIEFMTPWFLFFILLIFFILFIVRMFNVGEGDLKAIIGHGAVQAWIIVLFAILILFALGNAFGQRSLEATQGAPTVVSGNGTIRPLQPGDSLPPGDNVPQPGQPGATSTGDFSLNVINTLLHPKVMAIVAMTLIAMVAVWLITKVD